MPSLRLAHRWIEFDEHVASPDALAVAHVDRANDAGLKWLDYLCAAAWNDLARRSRDNVDAAERPGQRQTEQGDYRCPDRSTDWRGWRFGDLQRRRQKGELVLTAANLPLRKSNDLPSGCHGCPPAGSATSHSDRCCGSVRRDCRPR